MYNDPLIHGKNQLTRIVNVEIENDKALLFVENEDGNITTKSTSNKFWILSNRASDGSFKLKGSLHYNHGLQFSSRENWNKALQRLRKNSTDFFTVYDPKESFLIKDGHTFFKGMKHTEPSILSFDIESTGLYHTPDSKVLLISNTFRKNGKIIRKLFAYDEYESDKEFLDDWCSWVREMNPSLICGHNIYTYDFPYLQHVAELNGTELNLGRDGSALTVGNKPSFFRIDGSRDQEYHKIRVYGREVVDTMFLAIKHDVAAKKYDSYGLKAIIKVEGLEKEDRVLYDASQIRHNYTNPDEWEKIKTYCEHDADDSLALYDLMAPALFYATTSIPKSFQAVVESATGAQINSMMVRSYLQEGHSLPKASEAKPYEGAISFGEPGIYRNVYKVDVSSLYPSIMIQCEVYDEDKDPKGNFLRLVKTFTEERLKNKKLAKTSKYHDDLQNSQKILINSCYGFLGTPGLLFNSPSGAEFITKTGREILQDSIDWARSKGLFVVNADTDSISFNKTDGSHIDEDERKYLLNDLNSRFPERIRFEDDGYFKTFLVLKAKNYVLDDGKKIKYKGSAIKATQKEPALKEFIKKIIDSIMNHKEDYQEIYHSYIKEACNIKDIKRWATRKTISDKTLNSERSNEFRIRNTLDGTEYVEGDRIYTYYKDKNTLELVERFDGQYDVDRLLEKCYNTSYTFETVLDCDALFKNYKLKKNKKTLEELLNDA